MISFGEELMILHIIKKMNDTYAWHTASRQNSDKDNRVIILLLHDAVYGPINGDMEVFACQDDVEARGVKIETSLAGYEEIVNLLLDADSVICW